MIYLTLLGVLMALALLNRGARVFAIVLAAVWIATDLMQRADLYEQMPYVDAVAFNAIVILMLRRPSWWSGVVSGLSCVTMLVHLAYWHAYYLGLWFGVEYMYALQGLFLISVAVLVVGGYDVFERLGSILASLRNGANRFTGPVWARCVRRGAVQKET